MTETEKLHQDLVEDLAIGELDKLQVSFGGQPLNEKAKKYFLSEIRSRRWELGKGRNVTPLTATGAVLSDDHGWPVSFQDTIKGIASELFDVPESPGSVEPERLTEEAYVSAMQKATTPQERIALMKVWQAQHTKK